MANSATLPTFTIKSSATVQGVSQATLDKQAIHNSTGSTTTSGSNLTPPTPGTTVGGTVVQAPVQLAPGQTMVDGQILGTKQLTKFQFRQLFTLNERISIDNAGLNMALPAQARAAVTTLMKDLEVSGIVDLDLPQVKQGVNFLASVGLISATRAAQILAKQNPPSA